MEKIVDDVNFNLQYQNDNLKRELIEKINYVNNLENENENLKNKLKQVETEFQEFKQLTELNKEESKKNTSILSYIWNGFKN